MARSTTVPLLHPESFFIGGEWVAPSSDAKIDVIDAGTEEIVLQRRRGAGRRHGARRRRRPHAFDEGPWPTLTHAERAEYLRASAPALRSATTTLGELWPRESGALHKHRRSTRG